MMAHQFIDIIHNHVIICAFISWFIAQFLKIPFLFFIEKNFSLKRFWGSGGMPSSHTSVVISACVMVGTFYGFDSGLFAIMAVLASIVMYDATGVRRETGTQATVINEMLRRIFVEGEPITDKDLKELVGHTPFEVFGGFIVGLIVSLIYLSYL